MSVKELEERMMLTKEQYLELEAFLKSHYSSIKITHHKNRYLDDKNGTIRTAHNVLRIRSFGNSKNRELTYKVKGEDGDIEYNQVLPYFWFKQLIDHSRLIEGEVKEALLKDNVDITSLKVLIDLRTRRIEVEEKDYTIVLDGNIYNDQVDYNLEIESSISKSHAKQMILAICQEHNIEYTGECLGKSTRAFNSLK